MRGLPGVHTGLAARLGITPACAGTTGTPSPAKTATTDHPRVCGDYRNCAKQCKPGIGSPPRVRGLLRLLPDRRRPDRITPACAGTTTAERRSPNEAQDHPRVCGDYLCAMASSARQAGSPPRVRGLLAEMPEFCTSTGITPACAGTTIFPVDVFAGLEDHPRVCGDYNTPFRLLPWQVGSPPRVRGLPRRDPIASHQPGITPACAGTTLEWYNASSA